MKAFLAYGDKTEGPYTDPLELQQRMYELGMAGVQQIELHRADVVCDFCSFPIVRWLFQITAGQAVVTYMDSQHAEHHVDQDGRWGACDVCRDFILQDCWDEMMERSITHAYSMHTMMATMPRFLVELSVRNAHGFFRAGWEQIGKPAPGRVQPDTEFLRELGIDPLH